MFSGSPRCDWPSTHRFSSAAVSRPKTRQATRTPTERSPAPASKAVAGSTVHASSAWCAHSKRAAAGQQLENEHDHGDDEEQMNQPSANVHRESAEPQNDQDHDDDP